MKSAADCSAADLFILVTGSVLPRDGDKFALMSTSLVSGKKKIPMTTVIAAKMIGYHRPA